MRQSLSWTSQPKGRREWKKKEPNNSTEGSTRTQFLLNKLESRREGSFKLRGISSTLWSSRASSVSTLHLLGKDKKCIIWWLISQEWCGTSSPTAVVSDILIQGSLFPITHLPWLIPRTCQRLILSPQKQRLWICNQTQDLPLKRTRLNLNTPSTLNRSRSLRINYHRPKINSKLLWDLSPIPTTHTVATDIKTI